MRQLKKVLSTAIYETTRKQKKKKNKTNALQEIENGNIE